MTWIGCPADRGRIGRDQVYGRARGPAVGEVALVMVHVRSATEGDLEGIFAIYDREVLHGTATFETEPRPPSGRLEWLASHGSARHPAIVAEEGGNIRGWAALSPWSVRQAYARTAENSVYVDPAARGRGVGRLLMGELVERARAGGLGVVVARVVEGNPASLRLHESSGFRTVGIMRRVGEKFGRLLYVRIMDLHLDGGAG